MKDQSEKSPLHLVTETSEAPVVEVSGVRGAVTRTLDAAHKLVSLLQYLKANPKDILQVRELFKKMYPEKEPAHESVEEWIMNKPEEVHTVLRQSKSPDSIAA